MARVVRDGQAIEYEAAGSGPRPVLLLHNLLLDRRVFEPHVARLARGGRAVAPDLRGHGESREVAGPFTIEDLARDAVAVLDAEGIERATVAGVSLGAAVAIELALAWPARVAGLVLMGTNPLPARRRDAVQNTLHALALRLLGPRPGLVRAALPILFGPSFQARAPLEVAAWEPRIARLDWRRGAWYAVRAWCRRPGRAQRLGEVRAPTLVVAGEEDAPSPPALAELTASRVPGARLVRLRGGHSLTVELPDETAGLIEAHRAGT